MILSLVFATLIFAFFLTFSLVSFFEKEYFAAKRSMLLTFLLPLPILLVLLLPQSTGSIIGLTLLIIILCLTSLFLLPFKGKTKPNNYATPTRFDERNTMFSRLEITHRPELQKEYYKNNPETLKLDQEWHAKPGLMSEKSAVYSPLSFKAASASFYTIEQLRPFVNGDINENKTDILPDKASTFIKNWALNLGAVSLGICELEGHHFYSVGGRAERYNKTIVPNHKYAIAFTVEMDKEHLATGPAGPTLMESAKQYLNSGAIAIQIAKFIRDLGYEARAHVDGNYEVICPTVARDAGLGEIGRMGILMTPELGPRIRIAVVTTNLPLTVTSRKADNSVQLFCNICKKCADVCPSKAIPKNDMIEINGVHKWQINHEKCFGYWCSSGTDCGRCMNVCPYSHPNNPLHNFVRWGIRNNLFFRYLALKLDDFFYGRKPKPKKVPKWMKLE